MEPNKQVALLPEPADMTPMQMLQIAVAKGVDTEQIKALMELQRDWKADRAQEAFTAAMNAFRAESIEIIKRKTVSFKDTSYKHATLSDIVTAVAPKLSEHGLSHRWETKQEGPAITVSCIITHELGHSIQNSLTASPDTSGSKNSIQAIGSTVSYLQRYTFMAITGLAAKDGDDDGQAGEVVLATDEQLLKLEEKIKATTSRPVFLRWLRVETLEGLSEKDFNRAWAQLDVLAKNKK